MCCRLRTPDGAVAAGWMEQNAPESEVHVALRRRRQQPKTARLSAIEVENERLQGLLRKQYQPEDRLYWEKGHLFFQHVCLGTTLVNQIDTQGWVISSSGAISPSIACDRCGAHLIGTIEMRMRYSEGPYVTNGKPYSGWDWSYWPSTTTEKGSTHVQAGSNRGARSPGTGGDREL